MESKIGQFNRAIADILSDLNQPVDPSLLSQKPVFKRIDGKLKKTGEVSYLHWYDMIAVLNKFCPGYSWEVRTQFLPDRCVIEGRLTIKAAEGSFAMEATGVENLDSECYGDPVYSAESSALRRALAKFGFGIDLWRRDTSQVANRKSSPGARDKQVASKSEIANPELRPATCEVITERQLKMLWAIARKESGLADVDVDEIIKPFGYQSSKDIQPKYFDEIIAKIKIAGKYINIEERKALVAFCQQNNFAPSEVTKILQGCGYENSKQILKGEIEAVKKLILEKLETSLVA